jgi:hypothetical protein
MGLPDSYSPSSEPESPIALCGQRIPSSSKPFEFDTCCVLLDQPTLFRANRGGLAFAGRYLPAPRPGSCAKVRAGCLAQMTEWLCSLEQPPLTLWLRR